MRGNNKIQSNVMLSVNIPTLMIKDIAGRIYNVSVIVRSSSVNIESNGQRSSMPIKVGDVVSEPETGV